MGISWDSHIEVLGLDPRSFNVLRRQGMITVRELFRHDDDYILSMPGVGVKTAENILAARDRIALELGDIDKPDCGDATGASHPTLSPDTSISSLNLSVRATNGLAQAGMSTVGEVQSVGREGLTMVPNLGAKTVDEILTRLSATTETRASIEKKLASDEPRARRLAEQHRFQARAGTVESEIRNGDAPMTGEECLDVVTFLGDTQTQPAPLAAALGGIILNTKLRHIEVGFRRDSETLKDIAGSLAITSEGVRSMETSVRRIIRKQVAVRAPDLPEELRTEFDRGVCSEHELMTGRYEPEISYRLQRMVCREVLRTVGAKPAVILERRMPGWWAIDTSLLERYLASMFEAIPFSDETFDLLARRAPVSAEFPLREILDTGSSPIRLHKNGKVWVRSRCRNGDAAYFYLLSKGEATSRDEIAEFLMCKSHTTAEAMRRDERFVPMRPSGNWSLREWDEDARRYADTLDAGLAVLAELGRMTLEQYVSLVIARYPVSKASVRNTLMSDQIGIWPDGTIDLASRGAQPQEEKRPRQPNGVEWEEGTQKLKFKVEVDEDLLRGSGILIHSFITWIAGLRHASESREFRMDGGRIMTLRRHRGGAALSSMREWADASGATIGESILIELDMKKGTAAASLESNSLQS